MELYIMRARLCVCVLLMVIISSGQATEYLEDNCGFTISISDGIRLESQPYAKYDKNLDCRVTLRTTDTNQKLIIQFDYVNLQQSGSTSCVDYVALYDGGRISDTVLLLDCQTRDHTTKYWASSSNEVLIRLVSNDVFVYSGFSMTITAFHSTADLSCTSPGQFDCGSTGFCISNTLQCNGINDCTDNTDEIQNDGSVCTIMGPRTNKPWRPFSPSASAGVTLASTATTITMSLVISMALDMIG